MFVNFKRAMRTIAVIAILLASCLPSLAQSSEGVMVISSEPLAEKLAGVKATGEIKRYNSDNLAELVADRSPIYTEYRVVSASSRLYGAARVELFQTDNQFAAYGLLTYLGAGRDPKSKLPLIGMGVAQLPDTIIFYKGNYFARVTAADEKTKTSASLRLHLARAVAEALPAGNPSAPRPALFESLAPALDVAQKAGYQPSLYGEQYFLGPLAMNAFVERASDMFIFPGEAEAVMIETGAPEREKIKLMIVEYHTPQFATDAWEHLNQYLESLAESERARLSTKREGNYICAALSADNSDLAAQMVSSIEYPYSVKWLRNPLWPTNDPFRVQKAAQMLLSTFGILGAILGTVLLFGTVFGASVFLRRRKSQREAFSDAGGMLRLDLDPMESAILGLPPARGEE